jgi:hypothetical protein
MEDFWKNFQGMLFHKESFILFYKVTAISGQTVLVTVTRHMSLNSESLITFSLSGVSLLLGAKCPLWWSVGVLNFDAVARL